MLLVLSLNLAFYTNEGDPMSWVSGNYYLSQAERENNAALIWDYFGGRGWTAEAVAGMLGNMEQESTINPGIWQGLTVGTGGYGLVQWTPYTKYANWAGNQWENNGTLECQRIEYEINLTGEEAQWIQTAAYPFSMADYTQMTMDPADMASAWMKNYERAGDEQEAARRQYALNWYAFIGGQPEPPEPEPDEPTAQDQIPIWLLAAWGNKNRISRSNLTL